MRLAPVDVDALAEAADLVDPVRLDGVVSALVAEGLAEWHQGRLRLPGPPSPILTGTGARR
jgi:hypothetical protein